MLQRATVHLSWKHDSTSSGPKTGLLSGAWFVLNAMLHLSSIPHAGRLANRNGHMSAKLPLLPDQENEAALWLQPGTLHQSQSLSKLCRDQEPKSSPAVDAQTPVSNLFLSSQVAETIPNTLRRMPRLGEPGPLGMRAEHWYDFGERAGDSNLFVQVVAHIAAAAVPQSVL